MGGKPSYQYFDHKTSYEPMIKRNFATFYNMYGNLCAEYDATYIKSIKKLNTSSLIDNSGIYEIKFTNDDPTETIKAEYYQYITRNVPIPKPSAPKDDNKPKPKETKEGEPDV